MDIPSEPQADYNDILYTVADGDAGSVVEPAHAEPQRQVQRWLGRCMLSLQQSERLLKGLLHAFDTVAVHDGSCGRGAAAFEVRRAYEEKQLASMTLGGVVSAFLGFVALAHSPSTGESGDDLPDDRLSIRMRFNVTLGQNQWEVMQASMREMVNLRNQWVHHLVDRFDLWSVDGCAQALTELQAGFEKAERFRKELQVVAKGLEMGQRHFAELLSSAAGTEMLRTGKLPLEGSPVVDALHRAFQHSTHLDDESVLLTDVLAWLQRHCPDETPERYGRVSWQQLIHESRVFGIVRHGSDGCRIPPRMRYCGPSR